MVYSLRSRPDDQLGHSAGAQVEQDGRFVAEVPGLHTIIATCGNAVISHTLRIEPRSMPVISRTTWSRLTVPSSTLALPA